MSSCTFQDCGEKSAMERKHSKALPGAQRPSTVTSPMAKKILFLVDVAAAAASGRSAGFRKKRKVKPALRPEELRRICLSYNSMEKWCHLPLFASTVTGCFIRAVFKSSISDSIHCIAEIVAVMETETNLSLKIRRAGEEKIVSLRYVSRQPFTNSEFMEWKLAMAAAGMKVPTPEKIANKEKSIEEALDPTYTQREINYVSQKNRFRAAPVNFAKKDLKIKVDEPDICPEELRRICLSYNSLENWCHLPFFSCAVTGCFVRAVFESSISDSTHCIAEIVSVRETGNVYELGSTRTDLFLKLRHAGEDKFVSIRSVSRQQFTNSEFVEWKLAMAAAGKTVPTPGKVASKESCIKDALKHTFTEEDVNYIIAKKECLRAAPVYVPKREPSTKKKRQFEHFQGQDKKKARGEVNELALGPEELMRICLSYNRLKKWCHLPLFASTVTGCFVRAVFESSSSDTTHCIAEIVSVIETEDVYELGSTRTNISLKLRHAGEDKIVSLRSVSRQPFTITEFMEWKVEMMVTAMPVPTHEMVASKDKCIKEALAHTLTEGEIDYVVAQKERFRAAPLNFAKKRVLLLDKQGAADGAGDIDMVEEIQDELDALNQETKRLKRDIM